MVVFSALSPSRRDIIYFKSKILTGDNAIENAVHIMGRINTAVVHETAVMEGVDDFQYFERSIKGGRKAWELHKNSRNQTQVTVILVYWLYDHIESHTNGTYSVV